MSVIEVRNRMDFKIAKLPVGTILVYPDGGKERIEHTSTDEVRGTKNLLTQVKTINIKKDGSPGKRSAWLKFRHLHDFRHGGLRKGAGRPKTIKQPRKTYSFELFIADMELIPGNRAKFVRKAIRAKLEADELLSE